MRQTRCARRHAEYFSALAERGERTMHYHAPAEREQRTMTGQEISLADVPEERAQRELPNLRAALHVDVRQGRARACPSPGCRGKLGLGSELGLHGGPGLGCPRPERDGASANARASAGALLARRICWMAGRFSKCGNVQRAGPRSLRAAPRSDRRLPIAPGPHAVRGKPGRSRARTSRLGESGHARGRPRERPRTGLLLFQGRTSRGPFR